MNSGRALASRVLLRTVCEVGERLLLEVRRSFVSGAWAFLNIGILEPSSRIIADVAWKSCLTSFVLPKRLV